MKTTRVKTLVVAVFVLTLGAGVVAGLLASRLPITGLTKPVDTTVVGDGPLGDELGLTDEQRSKMKPIWESFRDFTEQCVRDSLKAQQERDRAIFALIPKDKVEEYREINSKYDNSSAAFQGRRKKAFEDAVNATKQLLTPAQQKKYDEILNKHLGAENGNAHDAAGPSPLSGNGV